MIAVTLGLSVILSQSAVGWQDAVALPAPIAVPVVVNDGVGPLMFQLQQSRCWWERDRAAIALGRVDPRTPGVLEALSFASTNDPDFRVRHGATRTLAAMAPATIIVHETVGRAAATDPCWYNRHHAKKALRRLPPPFVPACPPAPCGPVASPALAPGSTVIEPTLPPPAVEGPAALPGPALPSPVDSSVTPPTAEPAPAPTSGSATAPELSGPSARRSTLNRPRFSTLVPRMFRLAADR